MSSTNIQNSMAAGFKLNSRDLEEYLSVLARHSETPSDDDQKLRDLISSYAEFKFRTVGGARCGVCRAHVRHVVPVVTRDAADVERRFPCLCTRCFEGEKGSAVQMFLEMGGNRIEVKLHAEEKGVIPRVLSIPSRRRQD